MSSSQTPFEADGLIDKMRKDTNEFINNQRQKILSELKSSKNGEIQKIWQGSLTRAKDLKTEDTESIALDYAIANFNKMRMNGS